MGLLSQKTGLPSFSAVDASIVNYFSDPGFERGTDSTLPSGWLQYNDGAVAVPVDGTGGSANANVTLLVTTAGAIRGTKSALLTKGPGNQQGTGYSYDFTISNVDKGVTAGVDFELVTSAAYASGDVVFYIYDVTNSILITPRAVSLPALPNYGKFFTDYGLQTGTQYRFILHIATTNANAWTLKLDTMVNSTTRTAVPGAITTNEQSYPVQWTCTGTAPAIGNGTLTGYWLQDGEYLEGRIFLTAGSTTTFGTGGWLFSIPSGLTIDPGQVTEGDKSIIGDGELTDTGTRSYVAAAWVFDSTRIRILYHNDYVGASSNPIAVGGVDLNNPHAWGNTDVMSINFRVKIVQFTGAGTNGPASVTQWASDDGSADVLGPQGSLVPNVAFATGQTSRIFSFSIPQDLRQFVRTEINYRGNGWQSAADLFPCSQGNNGNASNYYGIQSTWDTPTNYRVFFGNRGTNVAASNADNGSIAWATEFAAGTRFRVGLSVGGVFIGINLVTATQSGFARAYNDLAKIRLHTGNGFGSINTTIRRFSTIVVNSGVGMTYADSATAGATFTCTENGVYSFSYSDAFNAVAAFGISLNSSQLATSIASITVADRLCLSITSAVDLTNTVGITLALSAGDIIRAHASAAESTVPTRTHFTVQRIL